MKKIVLSDGSLDEMIPFIEGLNEISSEQHELVIHTANWLRTGKWSEIRRYLKYFAVPLLYFLTRKRYDTIVGWQQFYALIYCFYCSLFHVKKRNIVIAVNYTYREKRGIKGKIYKHFMKRCMDPKYLDFIHVPSQVTANEISEVFQYPHERIVVTPFGIKDEFVKLHELPCPKEVKKEEYFLSIGRSNRDYDFLMKAWEGIPYKLIIISDTYEKKSSNPNITILRNVGGSKQYPWIVNSRAVIIPIDDPKVSSGDTVLLTAMSLKKIVIVTTPSTLAEMYIKNGENGLTVKKEIKEFRDLIEDVWENKHDVLQEKARESFLKDYSRKRMGKTIGIILK